MLHVWCKSPPSKVLSALAPIMGGDANFPIQVVDDFTALPEGAVVLALGSDPLAVLQAIKAVPKNRTITSLRGVVHEVAGKKVMLSYSPGIQEQDHGMFVDLVCDAKMAARLALTGNIEPKFGDYKYVDDFSEMIAEIQAEYAKTGKPVKVAHDTETLGSDPLHLGIAGGPDARPAARFVCWQFSHKVGMAHVKYFGSKDEFDAAMEGPLYEQIKWLLTTPMVTLRLANGKYDMKWHWFHTRKKGQLPHMECTNYKFDSTLVGNLLDENRGNGLKLHAKIYTSMGGYADEMENKYDKGRMDLVPKDVQLKYAGGDTDVELQVADAMTTQLVKDKRLTNFYINILHPASRAFECIERHGVYLDMDAWNHLTCELNKALEETTKKAIEILGGRLFLKHRDPTKPGGINLTKASLICDYMFSPTGLNLKPLEITEKSGKPATGLDHLLKFKDHPDAGPFIAALKEFSSASKMKGTYDDGFRQWIRSDGRLHPDYFLFVGNRDEGDGGAGTGRLSCKEPAFQTIPKHNKWAALIRRIFRAPPGFLVLERDYSQGELRVVACIANELEMIAAYRAGMDLHVKTGGRIHSLTYEQMKAMEHGTEEEKKLFKKYRQQAKPANFGLLYGQGWEGFQTFAENKYGVKFSDAEAQEIRTMFFQAYPGLPAYHKESIQMVHTHLGVVSPLGRWRHLPEGNSKNNGLRSSAERKGINARVQSTLADMMEWSLGIEWAQGLHKEAPTFGNCHDAAYDYVPEDKAVEYAWKKKQIMENLPFEKVGWKPQLKFIADCKLGPTMADLKDVDFGPVAQAA